MLRGVTTLGFDDARLQRLADLVRGYVEDGRLPGVDLLVRRRGETALRVLHGRRDLEAGLPVDESTLFRIYSMTKPLVSVAALMLYERNALDLNHPVSRYIPAFSRPRVYEAGPATAAVTRAASTTMTVKHLMTHTSGLTYGFHRVHVTDELYRQAGLELTAPEGLDLAGVCDRLAELPLRFDPGTSWNYSMSTDVLGRVVEVAAGKPLDQALSELVLEPLGMSDTAFGAVDNDRLAALYIPGADGPARFDSLGDLARSEPTWLSGGGGLVSTTADYQRFVDLLLRGGELDGARLLSNRTVAWMASNHLPGGLDLAEFGLPLFAETPFDGVGFGLGVSVTQDPVKAGVVSSVGEYGWGGLASTAFWVDPVEDLSVLFMTQLMPSSTYPIRVELKKLLYAALVD